MKYFLAILLVFLTLIGGFWLGKSGEGKINPQEGEVSRVDIYYLKADGIYHLNSENEGEEKLTEANVSIQQFDQRSQISLAGAERDLLIFEDQDQGLMALNLVTRQLQVIDSQANKVIAHNFVVSPDLLKVAFIKSIALDAGFKNELWLWDAQTGEKEKFLQEPDLGEDPEGVFYFLVLNGWLNNEAFLVGRSFEGVSYCPFTPGVDHSLSQQCSGFGKEGIGIVERILATSENGTSYGIRHVFREINSDTSQQGFFEQLNGVKSYLSGDKPTSLVTGKDQLYFIKGQNPDYDLYRESDLYSLDFEGDVLKRLTHDSTSVATKNILHHSNKGRFLSWHNFDISKIVEREADGLYDVASAWVYDLELSKYYVISNQAVSPLVVER
jgi:hypothetical protein